MSVRSLFITATWLLLLPLCLNAQVDAPKSRWVVGAGFGFSMEDTYSRDSIQTGKGANLIPVETSVEYRLSRWFSLTAHFSFGQFHISSVQSKLIGEGSYPFLLSYRIQTLAAYVAPRVQLRIWQGDLGVALGLGRYRQWYDQKAYGVNGQRYFIKYQGVNNDFLAFRTDYTYWPQQRFGVSIGLEAATSFGGPGRNAFPESRQPLPGNLEPAGVAGALQPRVGGYETTIIWVGFRYRL